MSIWNTKIKDLGKSESVKKGKKNAQTSADIILKFLFEHKGKILIGLVVAVIVWNIFGAINKMVNSPGDPNTIVTSAITIMIWGAVATAFFNFIKFVRKM